MRGPRSEAKRDETTVESMYVLVTAMALGGGAFMMIASPALIFDWVQGNARGDLILGAKAAAVVVVLTRLIAGLWRW